MMKLLCQSTPVTDLRLSPRPFSKSGQQVSPKNHSSQTPFLPIAHASSGEHGAPRRWILKTNIVRSFSPHDSRIYVSALATL
jgi:hypothetical protein